MIYKILGLSLLQSTTKHVPVKHQVCACTTTCEEVTRVTHRPKSTYLCRSWNRDAVPQEGSRRTFLLVGLEPWKLHGSPIRFLIILYQQKTCQLRLQDGVKYKIPTGTSLVIQWLRVCPPNTGSGLNAWVRELEPTHCN